MQIKPSSYDKHLVYVSDSFQAMDKAENEYDVPVDTFELQQSGLKTQNPVDSKQPQNKYCKMSLLYLVLLVLILLVQVVSLSLILVKKGASDQVIYLREDYINDLLSSSTEQIMQNFNKTSGYFAEHIMNSNYRLSNEQLMAQQNSTDLLRDAIYSFSKTKELASIFTILADLEENIQQLMVPKNSNNSLMIIEQLVTLQNSTDLLRDAVYSYNKAQELASIITSLTNLKDSVDSSAVVIDDILVLIENLIELRDSTRSEPLSCEQLRNRYPIIPSGYYHIGNVTIYCYMGELCNSTGGWTRLAYLNMSLPTENCPPGFQMYNTGGVRACGRVNVNTDCLPVIFPSNNISYSEICGRVVGYQHASTDAIDPHFGDHNDIDGHYVDGISITRGSPRQHVWTFMSGLQDEGTNNRNLNCPCSVGATVPVQSFIGEHYFCESGNPSYYAWSYNTLYIQDPLWDGQNCGTRELACCSATGLPWFYRNYGNVTTTDYLELRLCCDQIVSDEDVAVGLYEIYVK